MSIENDQDVKFLTLLTLFLILLAFLLFITRYYFNYKVNHDWTYGGGCESYRFISGLDEMAIPSEIGLYFNFEVTDDGIPYGCPGMEKFKTENFNTSK